MILCWKCWQSFNQWLKLFNQSVDKDIVLNSLHTSGISFKVSNLKKFTLIYPKLLWITHSSDLAIFELFMDFSYCVNEEVFVQNWKFELSYHISFAWINQVWINHLWLVFFKNKLLVTSALGVKVRVFTSLVYFIHYI